MQNRQDFCLFSGVWCPQGSPSEATPMRPSVCPEGPLAANGKVQADALFWSLDCHISQIWVPSAYFGRSLKIVKTSKTCHFHNAQPTLAGADRRSGQPELAHSNVLCLEAPPWPHQFYERNLMTKESLGSSMTLAGIAIRETP